MNLPVQFGEHYNARGLSPETIADSFVPPRQFWSVSASGNSVLVGPRGSGKTTLLHVLDPRALHRWVARNEVGVSLDGWDVPAYVGVFVPIDTAWVSSLGNAVGSRGDDSAENVYLAVYTLAIARSLVDVMRWRISEASADVAGLHAEFKSDAEKVLSSHLADIFLPGHEIRSLLELRLELSKYIAVLPGVWREARALGHLPELGSLLNPLSSTAAACEVFNTMANQPERKWALLCDELEIAPASVRSMLFAGLRAVPSPLYLKLALTPKEQLTTFAAGDPPLPANDYEVVSLSYPTREEGAPEKEREQFCVALWQSLVSEYEPSKYAQLSNPFKAFENPHRINSKRIKVSDAPADLESKFGEMFRSLAIKDASFAAYLGSKEIDVGNLDRNDQSKRDSVIRKVRAIVEVRNHYLRLDSKSKLVRKPRRAPTLYCGAARIFAVSEGHPRWLKYTLGAMLSRAGRGVPAIGVADQCRELRHSIQRMEARLDALPVVGYPTDQLVSRVGDFFSHQVLGEKFRADPSLSFVVDKAVSEDVANAVAQALYIGALVPLQGDVFNLFTKGLNGQRFRLSNWIGPMFGLPLMTGKTTNLSTILSSVAEPAEVQITLGLSDET